MPFICVIQNFDYDVRVCCMYILHVATGIEAIPYIEISQNYMKLEIIIPNNNHDNEVNLNYLVCIENLLLHSHIFDACSIVKCKSKMSFNPNHFARQKPQNIASIMRKYIISIMWLKCKQISICVQMNDLIDRHRSN